MKIYAEDILEYISQIPEDRRDAIVKLRDVIINNLPDGFVETMEYYMPNYVVPHSIYPKGYHCDPKTPLPFLAFASQKNFIALYHMGIYADQDLYNWFLAEYPKHSKTKIDMGKSCIRFKKPTDIPFKLIGELLQKMSVEKWIEIYESHFDTKRTNK